MPTIKERIKEAEAYQEQGELETALAAYGQVLDAIGTMDPKPHPVAFDLNLRIAWLLRQLGRRDECLGACSEASQIAVEQMKDDNAAAFAARKALETLREWKDWELAEKVAKGLVARGTEAGLQHMVMEAGLHMPYIYRGLGRNEEARQYAQVLLDRMTEIDLKEGVEEWTSFLAALPKPN